VEYRMNGTANVFGQRWKSAHQRGMIMSKSGIDFEDHEG
jgi:hypothetical protein